MTKYLQMLCAQRNLYAARAKSASHCKMIFRRLGCNVACSDTNTRYLENLAEVRAMDAKIQKESRHYGELRFQVIGPNR